ncbi:hypothetical protein [Micropruina sp.]|uniref:hypothetical protein n=1 Tax=Micropruina sp. TaxID=2737536 RepID=UPI0039E37BFE
MRRVIVLFTSVVLTLLAGLGTAQAAPARQGPQPATIRAKAATDIGSPGALVPVAGTLLDAKKRPLTGVPVVVTVSGAPQAGELQSLTGSGGAFEAYVPLPDQAPASGTVELQLSFPGSADAAATSLTLPVRVEPGQVPSGLTQPVEVPAPAATLPSDRGAEITGLPSSGSPLIDQLIVVATGLLGVMVLLIGIGVLLRRRRRS